MTPRAEVLRDGPIRGQKPLGVFCGRKSLHAPFPLARRLVRVFRAAVQLAMLAMLHARQELVLGRPIALQLVCDDHAGDVPTAFEQFTKALLGGGFAAPTLRNTSSRCRVSPGLGRHRRS
jgi:hypothetical protein